MPGSRALRSPAWILIALLAVSAYHLGAGSIFADSSDTVEPRRQASLSGLSEFEGQPDHRNAVATREFATSSGRAGLILEAVDQESSSAVEYAEVRANVEGGLRPIGYKGKRLGVTGSDGILDLGGQWDGGSLLLDHPDYVPETIEAHESGRVRVFLKRGSSIEWRCLDEQGRPVEGVNLIVSSLPFSWHVTQSEAESLGSTDKFHGGHPRIGYYTAKSDEGGLLRVTRLPSGNLHWKIHSLDAYPVDRECEGRANIHGLDRNEFRFRRVVAAAVRTPTGKPLGLQLVDPPESPATAFPRNFDMLAELVARRYPHSLVLVRPTDGQSNVRRVRGVDSRGFDFEGEVSFKPPSEEIGCELAVETPVPGSSGRIHIKAPLDSSPPYPPATVQGVTVAGRLFYLSAEVGGTIEVPPGDYEIGFGLDSLPVGQTPRRVSVYRDAVVDVHMETLTNLVHVRFLFESTAIPGVPQAVHFRRMLRGREEEVRVILDDWIGSRPDIWVPVDSTWETRTRNVGQSEWANEWRPLVFSDLERRAVVKVGCAWPN